MKIKLDENMSSRLIEVFRSYGHDVHTVPDKLIHGELALSF